MISAAVARPAMMNCTISFWLPFSPAWCCLVTLE
jgi:hypothetical protein